MHKILISGYYGFNNVGDEAILKGLIEGIKRVEGPIDIVVLSQHPEFTSKKHEVRSIKRTNLLHIFKEMKNMDLLVSGGGSLFQDVTSKRSIAYYIGIIWFAKRLFKKKVMIYSQGIGPVNKKYNRWLLGKILNTIDFINVRDEKSKLELESLGVTKEILVTTDTVFGISKPPLEIGKAVLEKKSKIKGKPYIGISVRHWKTGNNIAEEMAKLCTDIVQDMDCVPVLIPFHFYKDLKLMESIHKNLDKDIKDKVVIIDEYLYVEDYLSLIGNMDIMVAMRLHGLIFSVLMGVYPVGISYDPKIQSFLHMMDREDAMEVENLNATLLYKELKDVFINKEEHTIKLKEYQNKFIELADTHNHKVYDLLSQ